MREYFCIELRCERCRKSGLQHIFQAGFLLGYAVLAISFSSMLVCSQRHGMLLIMVNLGTPRNLLSLIGLLKNI